MHTKHKLAAIALCLLCAAGALSGCIPGGDGGLPVQGSAAPTTQATPQESAPAPSLPSPSPAAEDPLPDALPLDFVFASGAGAWGTSMTLNRDGTFQGQYSDSEMGENGEGYPHGTVYHSAFSGRFEAIRQIDDCTYAMTLGALTTEGAVGDETIEDQIRYVVQEPYGLESGKTFILYTPSAPLEGMDEEFLLWWPDKWQREERALTALGCYGVYNQEMGYGFFSESLIADMADEA